MDFATLQQYFSIKNNKLNRSTLSFNKKDFSGELSDFFSLCYQGYSLNLSQLNLIRIDEEQQQIEIAGIASYLNMPNISATLYCWLDNKQQVQLTIIYPLLGENPNANKWSFSKSFPDLPQTPDETQPLLFDRESGESWQKHRIFLDDIAFFNAAFIVSSCNGMTPDRQYPLKKGINFIASVYPEGPLAIAKHAFNINGALSVLGHIRLPMKGETTTKLRTQFMNTGGNYLFPWHVQNHIEYGLPGILLTVAVGIHDNFGENILRFSGDSLLIYTPISDDWVIPSTNPAFRPIQAFSGSLSLPGANINTAITLPFEPGINQWFGIAYCQGISIKNLSEMAMLSGSHDGFSSHIPKQLQALSKEFGRLELSGFSLLVDFSNLKAITVKRITVEVGIPELNWEIWPSKFELSNISCTFTLDNPFPLDNKTVKRSINSKLQAQMNIGDVPCSVTADSRDGFTFYAQMNAGNTISLSSLLKKYAPSIPVLGQMTVSTLRLGISLNNSYSLAIAMNEDDSFSIPIGSTTLDVNNVSMFVAYDKTQGITGSVNGMANYQDYKLSLTYESPGDVLIYSHIPKTSLRELLRQFTANELIIPKSFDLNLEENTIQIQKTSNGYNFILITEINGYGAFALQVGQQNGQLGAAFGLVMTEPKLSKLPGMSALKIIDDTVTLTELTLLASSFNSPSFSFPEMAALGNPSFSATSIPLPASKGIVAGFNAHASWQLDTHRKEIKLLKNILGLNPVIQVTLQIAKSPSDATRLFTCFNTKIMGHYPLSAQFGFIVENKIASLFLMGQLNISIHRQSVLFNIAMSVLPTGIYFAGSAAGTIQFNTIKLSNMGLALGFNWGGIPSFGISAQIDSKKFSSSIAIIADSTDPSKSVLAGSISQISLADITNEFAKVAKLPKEVNKTFRSVKLRAIRNFSIDEKSMTALDNKDCAAVSTAFSAAGVSISASDETLLIVVNKKGRIWSLTDMAEGMRHYTVRLKNKRLEVFVNPQIYIAPTGAKMGTLTFTQGYFLSGCLQILGQHWSTQVEVSEHKGIAATSYMDKPLQLVNKHFFYFSSYDKKRGPLISLSSFKQPTHEIHALRNPHFALSGRLCLLGEESATLANITTKGIDIIVESYTQLKVKQSFLIANYKLNWQLSGSLSSPTDMFLNGNINFSINGKLILAKLLAVKTDLGKIKINILVKTDTEIGYQNHNAYVELDAAFTFSGNKFHFALKEGADSAQLKKLANHILNEIKEVVKDLYNTAEEWINALDQGVIEIGKTSGTIGKALKSGYKQTAKETTQLLHKTGRTAEKIGNELKHGFNLDAQQSVKLLSDLDINPNEIGNVTRKTYKQTAHQAAKLLKNAGHNADNVTQMLKNTYGSSNTAIAKTLKVMGHNAQTVAKALKKINKASPASIAKALKSADMSSHDIGKALKSIGQPDQAVVKLLKGAGFSVKDISKVLKSTLQINSDTAAKLLKGAGINSNDIVKMLKASDLWKKSHKDIAKIMKKAGFGSKTVKSAMKSAGIAVKEIDKAFSWLKF
ncbi:MAG: hypothetical protein PUP46_07810 [Endozoicomonas sp. (ex Botrylloides leachii)]|nr:hypothetical protein [Endozoicomonas sp. (ex Botrylloides leachii)]